MQKQFKDLATGEKFTFNGESFTRIDNEQVSCCRTLNAIKDANQEKVMIQPLENVEVAD